jgi:nitroreductase
MSETESISYMQPTAADSDFATLSRLLDRTSCRAFQPQPVPAEVIEKIVTAAGRTPSWCNTQPWHLNITTGAETDRFRRKLTQQAAEGPHAPDLPFPENYTGKYRDRRRESGWQLYDSVGIVKGDREASARQAARNFALFDAPHLAILTTEADLGVYGVLDCGLFLQSFLLCAEAMGVGTIPQAAVAAYSPLIREHFALPDGRTVVCGISFGWPDTSAPANSFKTTRAGTDEILRWVGP